jgi:glycerate dehydrogenase
MAAVRQSPIQLESFSFIALIWAKITAMPREILQNKPRIVVLDGFTLNPGDLSWVPLEEMGSLSIYDYTPKDQITERAGDAEIILVNKAPITANILRELRKIRCIVVTATGYNNIDLDVARSLNIRVCNAVGYSTEAVVQHVFALLLELTNSVGMHNTSVQRGDWAAQPHFAYTLQSISELSGKTMGIYGFGNIGKRVSEVAMAFGMRILATHKHPERDARPGVEFVSLETLFSKSDVISLHAPLNATNLGIVNSHLLDLMKPGAFLINTGRGGLIHEADLTEALKGNKIGGAALDVLSMEPPPPDHPLCRAPHCIITPHIAWASVEARRRLMEITIANVRAFLEGQPQNIVV